MTIKRTNGVRVDHEKKSHGGELTMRKSHRVIFTIRKSHGVRVDHEKKSDGGELTMRKRAMG